jgi:nucleoside-triphosphatase
LKHIFLLAGRPGVGKTTVLLKTVETLKSKGYRVGGMISREVRSHGNRVGFEILSLSDNEHGWLAHVDQKRGPQVGRYHVNLGDLDHVGVTAIIRAVETCQVIAIDEIGPMELFSRSFKEAVAKAIQSMKLVITVVHWRERNPLILKLNGMEGARLFEVTTDNREKLHELIVEEATAFLSC